MKETALSARVAAEVDRAWIRIRSDIHWTPLKRSLRLGDLTGADIFVKWETEQKTGSFKFRGALNKLRGLSAGEKGRGLVSASTGNHALGMCLAARMEKMPLTLVLPESIAEEKKRRLEEYPVEIVQTAGGCDKAESKARELAAETGRIYVSPYNDVDIIAGQGTIGREIMDDLQELDTIVIPIGGGGLASGIGAWVKTGHPHLQVIGVEPIHSAFMAASLKAGRIVDIEEKETIAEAVAGGIEVGAVTFDLCRELVDEIVLVRESRIVEAMSILFAEHGRMVEGAGALPLAALLERPSLFWGKRTVLVASGGNISPSVFRDLTGR